MADPELRKRRPYGLYRHGDSTHPRAQHLAWEWHGAAFGRPLVGQPQHQNGWGCKCKKYMVSESDVERQGLSVGPAPAVKYEECTIGVTSPNGPRMVQVPKGIDPGFEYAPGQSRLSSAVPPLRAYDPLPETGTRSSSAQGAGQRRPAAAQRLDR